jgi:hypothetical protein
MKTLIIGMGEIGKALSLTLTPYYDTYTISSKDEEHKDLDNIDIMHIAFPYSDEFENEVSRYQDLYNPRYTVIHSTVPVGVSRKLNALHSPVRGKHPDLFESLLTFEKMIGGEDSDEVADYFRYVGMKVLIFRKQESTELAKLIDTLYYGVCIEYAKDVERLCEEFDVPFSEVYTLSNKTYNEGYQKLGYDEYIRPVLQPLRKKIGGHCVLQNTHLLKSKFAKFIRNLNK